jgi:hypothetical protein
MTAEIEQGRFSKALYGVGGLETAAPCLVTRN